MKKLIVVLTSLLVLLVTVPVIVHATGQKTRKCFSVVDENGEVVIGATITVEGKNQGTTTDLDGKVCIEAYPDDILIITYIGHVAIRVRFGSIQGSSYVVSLSPDCL